jgi:hypothetical protein
VIAKVGIHNAPGIKPYLMIAGVVIAIHLRKIGAEDQSADKGAGYLFIKVSRILCVGSFNPCHKAEDKCPEIANFRHSNRVSNNVQIYAKHAQEAGAAL